MPVLTNGDAAGGTYGPEACVYREARRAFGKNLDSCTAGEYWRINGANKVECSARVQTV